MDPDPTDTPATVLPIARKTEPFTPANISAKFTKTSYARGTCFWLFHDWGRWSEPIFTPDDIKHGGPITARQSRYCYRCNKVQMRCTRSE